MTVRIVPVAGLPEIVPGDDLAALLAPALRAAEAAEGDVVVVTSKIVSKAEGRLEPGSDRSAAIARETVRVLARRGDLVIAETRHGFVCANAGVDASNLEAGMLALLPEDPDASASRLRDALAAALGLARLGVVVTDTFGRPWRTGLVNVAIGCAGLPALVDERGRADHHGRELEATVVAYADEIAAASGLVMAKAARVPVAIVRGLGTPRAPDGPAADLIRPPDEDLFRESPTHALAASGARSAFTSEPVPRELLEDAVGVALADARALPPDLHVTVATSAAGRRAVRAELAEELRGDDLPAEPPVLIVADAPPGASPVEMGALLERLRLALQAHGLGVALALPGRPEEPVSASGRVLGVLACGKRPVGDIDDADADAGGRIARSPVAPTVWR